jgi:CRISP-associated protein Cas1
VTQGAADPVNVNLNMANSMLYGCAASVCAALSVNPALGIIHHGDAGALLYDLADVFKVEVSIPAAFASAAEPDPKSAVRRRMRQALSEQKIVAVMLDLLLEILDPFIGPASGDELLDDEGSVPALLNYHLE